MSPEDISTSIGIRTILELLAREAPLREIDEFVRRAKRTAADPAVVAELDQAGRLAEHIRSLFNRRTQREAGLSTLVDTARDLTLGYDLDTLLKVIARRARLLLGLDMSYISFHDRAAGYSYVRASDGHATTVTPGFHVPIDHGLSGQVTENDAPSWTADYLTDSRIRHDPVLDQLVRDEGLHAIIAVPLARGGSSFATLYVAGRGIRHFTPDEVALMASMGDLAAVAINKATLIDRTNAEVAELQLSARRTATDLAELHRISDIHTGLVDQVLNGTDLHTLIAQVADEFDGSVAVHDQTGELLAVVGDVPDIDNDELRKAVLDAHAMRAPLAAAGLWITPVSAGNEVLGALVLRPAAEMDGNGIRLLRVASHAVAVLLILQRSTAVAEGQFRDELLNDLLIVPQRPPQQLTERARRLAIDLSSPAVVVVVRPEGGSQGRAIVWASSYAYRMGGLKSVHEGCIVLLLPGTEPGRVARAVSDELAPLLGYPVTAGAGGPASAPEAVVGAYAEAMRCLEALKALGAEGHTASSAELGFVGLLVSDSPDVDGYIQATLGPVIDYDRRRMTELVLTLEAYFASGGSPRYAAESLHVHPNTVFRRLARITDLLGEDWQKPARAVDIQLALRLRRTRDALRPGETVSEPGRGEQGSI